MLQFYYHPLSPIARRVWLALLEKDIPFEAKIVDLKGRENLKPEYLELNPFHHVPVIVDDGDRILESFAILDYLEAKHPHPALVPQDPARLSQMRMIQMVTANEFMPKLPKLVTTDPDKGIDEDTARHLDTVLTFFSDQLGKAAYFGGDRISLADITLGAALPLTTRLGLDLQAYPTLSHWCDRVSARPAWQQTDPDADALKAWQRWISLMVTRHQRRMAKS